MKTLKLAFRFFLIFAAFLFCFAGSASADVSYPKNAAPGDSQKYPGVYYTSLLRGDSSSGAATIGIPSIAKQNLNNPTTQSPAIIMGAAVPYETRTGYTSFEPKAGGELYPPYSYFRYQMIEERNQNAEGTHTKMSGYDGSYVIIRADVSDLIANAPANGVLHVKQEGNKAMMVQVGVSGTDDAPAFSDGRGNYAAAYSLKNEAASLKDQKGYDTGHPYVDVILMSSGTIVQGADTGSTAPGQVTADVTLKFYVDETLDYNPNLTYDPAAYQPTDPNAPTLADLMLAKYYDESKLSEGVSALSYTVKGSDLELEVMNTDGQGVTEPEFWSLRKAMLWDKYRAAPIKLICEVPVLEGLRVDGGRDVVLDVNSFDIQIANHQTTGAAALTVENAKMTLMDGFGTTGAELAVGNNATMVIKSGGIFVIDESCQLEVEYDAPSTVPGENPPEYGTGVMTIESGGQLLINGVLTIEGTEGKPVDPASGTVRDKKNAVLTVLPGGKIVNNGCLLSYGNLFNTGTIENYGKYNSLIESDDPDRGKYTYHRGIQISWKDDVTQDSVYMGHLTNGKDEDGKTYPDAALINGGDIVLVPGYLENFGSVENKQGGTIFVCPVEEAVIPIQATVDEPYITEQRVKFGVPMKSYISIDGGGSLKNDGDITAASVEIVNNGRTGTLTELPQDSRLMPDLRLKNLGETENNGTISLDGVDTFEKMTNTGSVNCEVVLSSNSTQTSSIVYDKAANKLTDVYNAAKRVEGDTNIWTYVRAKTLTVLPKTQNRKGGETPFWTASAAADGSDGEAQFKVLAFRTGASDPVQNFIVVTGTETNVVGPVLPETNGNILYEFYIEDGSGGVHTSAAVTVSSDAVDPPAGIEGLVYNGKDQILVTEGFSESRTLEYKLGAAGTWQADVPSAKNAGTYTIYYRLAGDEAEAGSFEVTIAKRELIISADDIAGPDQPDPAALTFTVSGLAEGESLSGIDGITASVEGGGAGTDKYVISLDITSASDDEKNSNYDFISRTGTYTVTGGLKVTAKDKYGVFSDDISYKGFNILLNVNGKDVGVTAFQDAEVYFSLDKELTEENYNTIGWLPEQFPDLPAGAGKHRVWYYVRSKDGTGTVGGSKYVIIDKAKQTAPENILAKAETYRNSGDGRIMGFVPRTMEYRKEGSGKYETAYYQLAIVPAGTYMVRKAGDKNHYPGPDLKVVVEKGPFIVITFDSNGGSAVPVSEGHAVGDILEKPDDPVYAGHKLQGWYHGDDLFDFNTPLAMSMTLTAHWTDYVTFTVRFDAGGGSGSMDDVTDLSGEYKLPACLFGPPEGKVFDKWLVEGKTYAEGDVITVGSDLTVTAQWKDKPAEHVHKLSLVEEKKETCTEDGNTAYYVCTECGLWFEDATGLVEITDKASVIRKASGHKWDEGTVTKEPTEKEPGIRTFTCQNDSSHKKTEEIPVLAHTHVLKQVSAMENTCTEEGHSAYYVCETCGHWFSDAEGKTEITDHDSVKTSAKGHRWDEGTVTKEPTETEPGIRTFTCLNDPSHTKTEEISAKGNTPSEDDDTHGDDAAPGSDDTPGDKNEPAPSGDDVKPDKSRGSRGSGSSSGGSSRRVRSSSASGSWSHDGSGWHFREGGVLLRDTWRYLAYQGISCWYYFDADGLMKTGWLSWNGNLYYLNPVPDGWMGRMLTGWQFIEGKWYYFETANGAAYGQLYRSRRTPDGYYVGEDGAWDGMPASAGE